MLLLHCWCCYYFTVFGVILHHNVWASFTPSQVLFLKKKKPSSVYQRTCRMGLISISYIFVLTLCWWWRASFMKLEIQFVFCSVASWLLVHLLSGGLLTQLHAAVAPASSFNITHLDWLSRVSVQIFKLSVSLYSEIYYCLSLISFLAVSQRNPIKSSFIAFIAHMRPEVH